MAYVNFEKINIYMFILASVIMFRIVFNKDHDKNNTPLFQKIILYIISVITLTNFTLCIFQFFLMNGDIFGSVLGTTFTIGPSYLVP